MAMADKGHHHKEYPWEIYWPYPPVGRRRRRRFPGRLGRARDGASLLARRPRGGALPPGNQRHSPPRAARRACWSSG
eukprot:scaffold59241_cov57-Phaeocystis_antarctica.AAC.8